MVVGADAIRLTAAVEESTTRDLVELGGCRPDGGCCWWVCDIRVEYVPYEASVASSEGTGNHGATAERQGHTVQRRSSVLNLLLVAVIVATKYASTDRLQRKINIDLLSALALPTIAGFHLV